MHTPGRGDGALRRYRVSLPAHSYFLTLCTETRFNGLTQEATGTAIRTEISAIEADRRWSLRAGVLMPDHIHLFVRLGGSSPIDRCVARLKTKTRPALSALGIGWQRNFYEHRLRAEDRAEDVVRYIFLDPFRSGLIAPEERYRWFWLGTEEAAWFDPHGDHDRPLPEWLQ